MRYIGGKHRISNWIAQQIDPLRKKHKRLIEPFCGGMSATVAIQPNFAYDASVPLISLIQACRMGWSPPCNLTEIEYQKARELPPEDPLHGFASFCCSFGGKYWGGYARESGRNFALQGRNSLLRKIKATKNVEFNLCSYDEISFLPGDLVYCDPPYSGTTMGYSTPKWDSDKFWDWAKIISNQGITILVSEFNAPDGVELLACISSKTDIRAKNRDQTTSEKIFLIRGY